MPDLVKDTHAIKRLAERIANKPEQRDNSRGYAGSPMYFYCRMCGHQSDCLPESYSGSPAAYCTDCSQLKKANPDITDKTLLELAKAPG